MPDRVRIYHPETGEPFDCPVAKATDLRLNKGWTSTPVTVDPNTPVVTKEVFVEEEINEEYEEESEDDA